MLFKTHKLPPILTVLLTLFTLTLIEPSSSNAQTLLFEDDFNDNYINNQWLVKNYTHEVLGTYSPWSQLFIEEQYQKLRIFGEDVLSDKVYEHTPIGWFGKALITCEGYPLQNFTVITKVNIMECTDGSISGLILEFDQNNRILFNIGVRSGSSIAASQLVFDENGSKRYLCNNLENENNINCPNIPMEFSLNENYVLKLEFNNISNVVKAYINNNITHIGTFKGNLSDFHAGIAAAVRYEGNYIDARFDDFKLYANTLSNIILDVPDIKQFSIPWGALEYDSAKKWYPNNPTISRWGCALTSASMLLKYYGHDINPDALNEWLNAQKDGYTRNGGIIWPTVSRLTEYRWLANHDWPILEFAYLTYTKDKLKDEIENERPGILKLVNGTSTHFIVGKGYNDSDIFINDPGKDGHTTLSQANSYWGSASRIGRFKKSETDLSYIVLYIDDGFDIEVESENGKIEGDEYYFKEGPMTDPENPAFESGLKTLNAFYYPKPESGEYKVRVSGEGTYRLDYYIYDETGEVKMGNSFSSLTSDQSDEYRIDFDKLDLGSSHLPQTSYESVLSFWDSLYENEQIMNQGLYLSVKQLLQNSFKNSEKNYSSEILLKNILHIVQNHGQQETAENALYYLEFQIEALLSKITI